MGRSHREKKMQVVYIMQGVPGSGKSTVADALAMGLRAQGEQCNVRSTDDLFIEDQGQDRGFVYAFRPEKLGAYHEWNQRLVAGDLAGGLSVIVDNCNTRCWEARPYVEAAQRAGANVVFVRCNGKFKNVHGVPDEKVESLRQAMEDLTEEKCLAAERPVFVKKN